MPTREPGSQLQLLSLWLRHFRIHTETWSRREQQSVDTAQSSCSPWSSFSGGWVPPFIGIQRSQQREVKENIAATFHARNGLGLDCGFSSLLSLLFSSCLIPPGVATSQHAYHWSSESPHGLSAFCWASVHNDASFLSSPEVLLATFTFSWVLERGLSTLDFIRIENQAGRHFWFLWHALQSDPFLARECWLPDSAKIRETEHLAVSSASYSILMLFPSIKCHCHVYSLEVTLSLALLDIKPWVSLFSRRTETIHHDSSPCFWEPDPAWVALVWSQCDLFFLPWLPGAVALVSSVSIPQVALSIYILE